MSLPDEDRYLKTRKELVDHIAVLLAGRAAEQLVFGEVTTGAADDLQRVAEITHAMVHQYAMGSVTSPQRAVLDVDVVSDITRRIRDEEQRELAYEGHALADALIASHRTSSTSWRWRSWIARPWTGPISTGSSGDARAAPGSPPG